MIKLFILSVVALAFLVNFAASEWGCGGCGGCGGCNGGGATGGGGGGGGGCGGGGGGGGGAGGPNGGGGGGGGGGLQGNCGACGGCGGCTGRRRRFITARDTLPDENRPWRELPQNTQEQPQNFLRYLPQQQLQQELWTELQTVSKNSLSAIKTNQDLLSLNSQAKEYSHSLESIVYNLQEELVSKQGEAKNVIRRVSNELSAIRDGLIRVIDSQAQGNVRLEQLKAQLSTSVKSVDGQIEKLLTLTKADLENQQQIHNLNALIRSVVLKVLSAARKLQIQRQIT